MARVDAPCLRVSCRSPWAFVALNGGSHYHFTEAVPFVVNCETQDEVDDFWGPSEGGEQGPCGWLKDKYGLSWQVVPTMFGKLIRDPDSANRTASWRRCCRWARSRSSGCGGPTKEASSRRRLAPN
jgi:hypothetical protein